ncbi:probetacellulin isoform X3 [Brachionichthys hirsutus]|uniref:probetacellulin isoform X3 n=1 Tax=Brachionichthys hirsutus TaxID=412623 RepID=UPI00360438D2
MAQVCRLYVRLVAALVLCKHSLAEGNSTDEPANRTVSHCHHHGNGDNCTDKTDTGQWGGHFSKCPEELLNYCVHGDCRYIKEQEAPSCRCHRGFIGARCEFLDLDWRIGDKRQIIIACVIAGLVFLTLLVVFICICSSRRCRLAGRRRRRREEPGNGMEKLSMMDASVSPAAPPDPPLASAV